MIKKYKYTTDDGYINTVFRLRKKVDFDDNGIYEQRGDMKDNDGETYKIADAFINNKNSADLRYTFSNIFEDKNNNDHMEESKEPQIKIQAP